MTEEIGRDSQAAKVVRPLMFHTFRNDLQGAIPTADLRRELQAIVFDRWVMGRVVRVWVLLRHQPQK